MKWRNIIPKDRAAMTLAIAAFELYEVSDLEPLLYNLQTLRVADESRDFLEDQLLLHRARPSSLETVELLKN